MSTRPLFYFVLFCALLCFHSSLSVSAQSTQATYSDGTNVTSVPDVFLDVNLSVPLIQLIIDNVTAHVSLDAQVANLVKLSAGVDASISRLNLTIKDISAQAHLEARLHEVTLIVQSVMNALNNSPLLLALALGVNNVADTLAQKLGGTMLPTIPTAPTTTIPTPTVPAVPSP